MKVLFVDDDPENVEFVADTLRGAVDVEVVTTVEAAVEALLRGVDVLVMDLFIPLGAGDRHVFGPRAVKYRETIDHLGGLVLLDELDRLDPHPLTLLHTACRDHVLLELLGRRVARRLPKPAPAEMLLNAVLDAVRERQAT